MSGVMSLTACRLQAMRFHAIRAAKPSRGVVRAAVPPCQESFLEVLGGLFLAPLLLAWGSRGDTEWQWYVLPEPPLTGEACTTDSRLDLPRPSFTHSALGTRVTGRRVTPCLASELLLVLEVMQETTVWSV